ncbi:MAG: AAA family ATPase [Bacteroidota bacterium]
MEKINHIEINNFKSIKHLKVDGFKKINVFIGYPNAGKSNILEALGLLGMIDFGEFRINDVVRFNKSKELFFEENIFDKIGININNALLTIILSQNKEHYFSMSSDLRYSFTQSFENDEIDLYGDSMHSADSKLGFDIRKYHFIGNPVKTNYFDTILKFPFGDNLFELISFDTELRKIVTDFFEKNSLKILLDRGSSELKVFKEYLDGTVFTLPYNLIADTLQRLIFYKAAILSNHKNALLFEEPEAHCFEPYILEFTNSIKYDKNDNQFFIVTHSDFIIQEFLRDEESKKNTNIYLVNNVDGETKVKQLLKEKNEDVYEYGMNPFFNFENLWETN